MLNASTGSTLNILNETKNKFLVSNENHFLVLPDAKTVVGSNGSDPKKLIMQDITLRNSTQIGAHSNSILTVIFNKLTQSLLVGDFDGHVKQYKKEKESFSLVKEYEELGAGHISLSAQAGRFAIFGGSNGSLIAIDTKNQKPVEGSVKTVYKEINSLQVCLMNNHEMFLSVSGNDLDFSPELSDIFDLSCMAINDPTSLKKSPFKDLAQANKTILIQQMTIESLEERIEGLKKYKYENEEYKQKLEQTIAKYQSLKRNYESIKVENESINTKFKVVNFDFDTKYKKLIKRIFIMDKLRKRYTHQLHNPPKCTFFENEDQSKTISYLEKKIDLLNEKNELDYESLQKSTKIQKITEIENQSLKKKRKETEKELRAFQTFISEW